MSAPQAVATIPAHECRCVRLSPDGTAIVIVGPTLAELRETADGRVVWSRPWDTPAPFVAEAVWGTGGDTVTLLAGGALSMLDAATGDALRVPPDMAERRDVTALALAHDGVTLAVGTQDGAVLLWEQATGQVTRLRGGGDPVSALAWRPGVEELCVTRPRSTQFWTLDPQTMISSINMGDVYPLRLAWSPDGALIAVAGLRDVRAIAVSGRVETAPPFVVGDRPSGLGFSRTGSTLFVGMPDGSVRLLDRQLRERQTSPTVLSAAVAEFSHLHVNETGLLAVRADPATVALYRLADTRLPSTERRTTVALRRWAAGVARSIGRAAHDVTPPPVPRQLAKQASFAWAAEGWILGDRDRNRVTRHAADGERRWKVKARPGPLAVYDHFVAVTGDDGELAVLDADDGSQAAKVAGMGPAAWAPQALAVTAPAKRGRVATELLVYDRTWGKPRLVPVRDGVSTPAWAPDGSLLAAPSAEAVVIWEGETLVRARRLAHGSARPTAASWSPDGAWIAVDYVNAPVTLWSTRTWTADQALGRSTPPNGVLALAWSPDSRLLAIASPHVIGAVDLWDVRRGRPVLTVPPAAERRPVTAVDWAADGRFAVVHDDGRVIQWQLTLPLLVDDFAATLPYPEPMLAALAAGMAAGGTMVSLALLADLVSLLLGRDAGPLAPLDGHPGLAILRGLRWPPEAVIGLAVLVASGLSGKDAQPPPADAVQDDLRAAVELALGGLPVATRPYEPPISELLAELDRIDDSVEILAILLGPDAVAMEPDLLARLRAHSFGGWSLTPRQRRLLGLRSALRSDGTSQGQGLGDTRAGIARNGELPSLLPTQLALPRLVLTAKMSRDELLYRTRQGELPTDAQPVVLILDDTPAAHGAIGVTLRLTANLLASIAIRQHRRCALVLLSSGRARFLDGMADLVHVWTAGSVERPSLPRALAAADEAAGQLSDPLTGLPRLVLLTHPFLACSPRSGLHIVRVRYPGVAAEDQTPRTHLLGADADPEELHAVIGAIVTDRS